LAFGDFRQMIREAKLDAVAIATPPSSQTAIAEFALTQGCAVFAEKPMTVTVAQAERLMQLARQKGVANMVDFLFPEIAAWERAKQLLHASAIGNVHACVVNWIFQSYDHQQQIVTWKTDQGQGGGVVPHFASHTLFYLEFFLGRIRRVSAQLAKPPDYPHSGDTLLALVLRFENGATAHVTVCSNAPFGSGHRVEFHGDRGSLVLASPSATAMDNFALGVGQIGDTALQNIDVTEPLTLPPTTDNRVVPLARLTRRFVDWIDTGVATRPNFADGWRVQQLIEAIYASARNGALIEV
jgi:predicted dehydrogenase